MLLRIGLFFQGLTTSFVATFKIHIHFQCCTKNTLKWRSHLNSGESRKQHDCGDIHPGSFASLQLPVCGMCVVRAKQFNEATRAAKKDGLIKTSRCLKHDKFSMKYLSKGTNTSAFEKKMETGLKSRLLRR